MPRPGSLVVKKGSPTLARMSGGMPAPRSCTAMATKVPRGSMISSTGASTGDASSAFLTIPVSACAVALGGTRTMSVAASAGATRTIRARASLRPMVSRRATTCSTSSSALIGCASSPRLWPASAAICVRMARQRSTCWRMSWVSSTSVSVRAPRWIWRSSSLAATAMVDSGVDSSCAAPADSVASEASLSLRAWVARVAASSASRARSARRTPLTK